MTIATLKPWAPGYVPAELAWDHSFAEFARELDDPFAAAARLHDGPGIVWTRDAGFGNPGWLPTRHDIIRDVLIDFEHFSSARVNGATNQLLGVSWRLSPLEFDPPAHHAYRQILHPFFTPRAVNGLNEAVQESCDTLLAEFEERGSCEFIGEFASRFPAYIFLALLGMPRDRLPQFLEWEHALLRGSDNAERVVAARAILHYLEEFTEEQRQNPSTDLLKAIFSARIGDRPLNEGEILGMLYLLYIGGLDTVNSTLGWVVRHLAIDQLLQGRLRARPEDIPLAVEELSRIYAIAMASRTVTADFEFRGVPMRRGDHVLIVTSLANRDPRAFEDPHKVDIDRRVRNSLSFATGPHICLGVHLAKREIRIVIEAVLARLQNLRIPEGESYEFHTRSGFGIDRLPLAWDR